MTKAAPPPVTFLLVDDLDENLLSLEGLLRRDGLVLLKARSGAEALELLLRHEVALALVDVRMPGMDGFELAELMRGTERTRRVPIIFLTAALPDQSRRFRGYEAGAVDFLTKPIEPHVLRSKAGVFFELWRERQEVARQRDELKVATAENARLLAETQQTAQALREADRKKDEFLATLAHELRNPLAPLRNGVELLKLAPTGPSATQARNMMERQLRHMVRLVDDLLDISRVTSGKIQLRIEPTSLRAVIEAAVETSRHAIEAGRHALSIRLDEPLRLNADATRVSQVLGNLLTNAAKYTPEGGRIELAAERAGDTVVLRVTDNGLGIAKEMLPRVFDLFTQVGKHMDRAQGGLGIGLALVKSLVELHGGYVTAESGGLGKGSTFTVRLPIDGDPGPSSSVSHPEIHVSEHPRRILVVDDNVDAAESLALLLTLTGHSILISHSGPEALAAAPDFRPEVAFLDLGLPGMDGFELARSMRADPRYPGIVLVALTGWGSDEDRQRTREAGFDHHLTKPIGAGTLGELLAKLPVAE